MALRLIFLDLDGTLNNLTFMRKYPNLGNLALDPKNIAALNGLIAWTQAKIVISSDWRLRMDMQTLRRLLADQGLDGDIIDRTPELPGKERCDEIQTWLDMTEHEVESFVILDDSEMGYLKPHLVRTVFSTGLTESEVQSAARVLLASSIPTIRPV